MSILSLIASMPQIQSRRRARDLIAELHVLGLTIVPTHGYRDFDELLDEISHDPLCEAMRPDDAAPLVAHMVDP